MLRKIGRFLRNPRWYLSSLWMLGSGPELMVASSMELEGYTDFNIELEVYDVRRTRMQKLRELICKTPDLYECWGEHLKYDMSEPTAKYLYNLRETFKYMHNVPAHWLALKLFDLWVELARLNEGLTEGDLQVQIERDIFSLGANLRAASV
jgi:hypothetical protein